MERTSGTYRNELKHRVGSVDKAFEKVRKMFLSEENKRASDALWELLNFKNLQVEMDSKSVREALCEFFVRI